MVIMELGELKMRRLIEEVGSFFASGINRLFVSVMSIGLLLVGLNLYIISEIKISKIETLEAAKEVEKKVDFRYFNLTNSLQDIHNIKIETNHGRIEK